MVVFLTADAEVPDSKLTRTARVASPEPWTSGKAHRALRARVHRSRRSARLCTPNGGGGRQGRAAHRGRFGALLRGGGERGGRRAGRLAGGAAAAARAGGGGLDAGGRGGVHRRRRGVAAAAVRGEWFPQAVAVVDFFYAAEYVWAAARARYGRRATSRSGGRCASARLLKAGRTGQGAGDDRPGRRRGERPGGGLHRGAARADALRPAPRPQPADRPRAGARRPARRWSAGT